MDRLVQKIVALGVPGLVLVFVIGTTGLAGGAAVVSALAALGGPLGMLGGIAALGVLGLIADTVAKYGLEAVFRAVVAGLKSNGMTDAELRRTIAGYPITEAMKKKILDRL